MMNFNDKGLVFAFFFVVLALALVQSVGAVGVAFTDSVEVLEGQSVDKALTLQNVLPGNGDLIFTWEVVEGSDYVSFPEGNDFRVDEGKTKRVKLNINPGDASVGDVIFVNVLFNARPVSSEGEDTVNVIPGIGFSFDVKVVDKLGTEGVSDFNELPSDKNYSFLIGVFIFLAVVVLVVLVAWLVLRRRNQQVVSS